MNLVDELRLVTAKLEEVGLDYAICGGVAVTIHGATRSTKDIDLLIPQAMLEEIVDAVRPLGWKFRAAPMTFDQGTDRERIVHRVTKIDGDQVLTLDLILVEPRFSEIWAERIAVDLPGAKLRVVSFDGLIAMKRMARRPQDIADIEKLEGNEE